jgi:pilus assembly protein CpaC
MRAVGRLLSLGAACCLALAALGGGAFCQEEIQPSLNDPLVVVSNNKSTMQIVERFSKIAKLPGRIVRVDGFDPAVINVTALSPTEFRIQAIAPGVTTVVFADENGGLYSMEVFISGDVRHLQAYIDRLFPGSAVKAVAVRDSVVLRGWVTRPEDITAIVEIAEQFYPRVLNQMQVGGAQQVILKVKVMEVQRSKIRQLGFNFLYLNQNLALVSTPGQLTQLLGLTTPFGAPPSATVGPVSGAQIAVGLVDDNSVFQGFLEALKREALLKILAEPTLNTSNGRPANLLAGGEFPILVPQSLGTTTIEYREFGVRLEAVPTILGGGRVRLELAPEVSERDFTNSVLVGGQTVPGLTTRRVNTQVEMKFGQTYMLAGLLSLRRTASTNKIPFLGELPWVGAAFRRVSYEEGETELVIMVTPEIAGPMSPEQVPPGGPGTFTDVPTDRELYRDGMLEVPSYGNRCDAGCDLGGLPGTRLHYATPCEEGSVQPGPAPAPAPATYPAPHGGAGFGTMPAPNGQPAPNPFIPTEAPQAPPASPETIPAPAPEFGMPPMEDSAIQPTSHKEWYQYNPRSANRGNAKAGSRPGLIEPGK